jgi:3-oxoisoapionate decarboxylase
MAAASDSSRRLGVTLASYGIRWGARGHPRKFKDALDLLDHCHALGAGGIQVGIGNWDRAFVSKLRSRLEETGLYLEGQIGLPKDTVDLDRFRGQLRLAKEAGADIIRTVALNGRRYETFHSAQEFRDFAERAWHSLAWAEPLVRKLGLHLALENHKDWRVDEMLALLKRLDSPQVGVCVDTGNSISLLETPAETVQAYAPWALTSHFKDMALESSPDGFLLSEVPLGDGFLDLKEIVAVLRRTNPSIRLNLEMITRDPLSVPCLTDGYWATMPSVPAQALARTLGLVRAHPPTKPLPRVTGSTRDQSIDFEEANVRASFAFAREHLGLG